jgi:epoxyqueuosine reductase
MELKLALKQRALDIGFDLVGIAPLVPGKDLVFARQWVERGYGGEMRYLANPKRFDPRLVLASAKSVVCVGLVYNAPLPYSTEVRSQKSEVRRKTAAEPGGVPHFEFPVSPRPKEGGQDARAPRAWISRYAWGRDYHEIVRAKLEKLRAAVEELAPDVETRVFVDTGPIVERAFARFSGLGWMGKNTCIINEAKGSWLFLGVMLTSLELEPDVPAADRCGSCTACLEACPTGALVEPYVMDASRCISYLTIELKGSIPEQSRSAIGANVFGCDICQDVCPWNAKGRSQEAVRQLTDRNQESNFQPRNVTIMKIETGNSKLEPGSQPFALPDGQRTKDDGRKSQQSAVSSPQLDNHLSSVDNRQFSAPSTFSLFSPRLEALASLTEEGFRRVFARSPIKRAKYRGWLRNLCVAMGNSGEPRRIPWLEEKARDADPIIREHAAWALQRLQT